MATPVTGVYTGHNKEEFESPVQWHPIRQGKIPSIKWRIDTVTEAQKGLSQAYTKTEVDNVCVWGGDHLFSFAPFGPVSSCAKHRRDKHRSFALITYSKWSWYYKLGKQTAGT